jgi:two-component system response regulator AtoC
MEAKRDSVATRRPGNDRSAAPQATGPTVLVIDDEERMRRVLAGALEDSGFVVETAGDGALAIPMINESTAAILTDVRMPQKGGLDVLDHVLENYPDIPVILMTAYGTVDSAVDAMKRGAYDYVTKPFNLDEVELIVGRAVERRRLARDREFLRSSESAVVEQIRGDSQAVRNLRRDIARVASSSAAVLVLGETGVGKELCAKAIHSLSDRKDRLLVNVNCAAIPADLLESELFGHAKGGFTGATTARAGKFEMADGGTLFLDEIGDMSLDLQSKLLRVLEDGSFERVGSNTPLHSDARIVSATNRNLNEMVRAGTFRADLFYRLNVLELKVPSLRERREDIRALAEYFLARTGHQRLVLDEESFRLLEDYDWPGNIRELRNVCERLSVLFDGSQSHAEAIAHLLATPRGGEAEAAGEPPRGPSGEILPLAEHVARAEEAAIRQALEASGDNKPEAARLLGISERTLWYKLKKIR